MKQDSGKRGGKKTMGGMQEEKSDKKKRIPEMSLNVKDAHEIES